MSGGKEMTGGPLTKKEKGRLKKLRKRALEVKEGCETSGITQNEDWEEYGSYMQRAGDSNNGAALLLEIGGPAIRLRKKKNDDSYYSGDGGSAAQNIIPSEFWQRVEGADHSHILCNLLFPQQPQNDMEDSSSAATKKNNGKKKRHRQAEIFVPPPSWATLHNPASVESVAVLQIQVESSKPACTLPSWDAILAKLSSIQSLLLEKNNSTTGDDETPTKRVAVPLQTRWFQGPNLKSMSDTLLYIPKTTLKKGISSSSKKQKLSSPMSSVLLLLNDLVLSRKDRSKEGYPLQLEESNPLASPEEKKNRKQAEEEIAQRSSQEILSVSKSFPLSDAQEIVNNIKILTNFDGESESGGEDAGTNEDPYVSTLRTSQQSNGAKELRVFAVDCEMVATAAGYELARVTLLQLQGFNDSNNGAVSYRLVIDELVKPARPVLDYKTNYSGITAKLLEKVTMRREQIQAFLLSYLTKDDILIGHSLENDLRALRLVHDKVVDTSVLFRSLSRRKYSLKHLSATLLKKKIQMHSDGGHCSEEDAFAALDLAVRRAWFGSSFRIYEKGDDRNHLLQIVLERNKQSKRNSQMVCLGPSDWLQEHVLPYHHSAHALTCSGIHDPNTKAMQSWLTGSTRRARIVWADLQVAAEKDESYAKLNEILTDLLGQISPGTMVLLAFQRGHRVALEMAGQRKVGKNPKATLAWSDDQETTWQKAVETARSGLAFWVGMP